MYLAWRRVSRYEALDQYVRRVLMRSFLDEKRRPWRREFSHSQDGDVFEGATADEPSEERIELLAALATVPPRQRAVIVLRFWADLSVEQVAATLDCAPGTVKSQCARGLRTLREALEQTTTVPAGPRPSG